ncbi:MAG TPA: FHA domain-containing protein [Vulgatibacter sp.]
MRLIIEDDAGRRMVVPVEHDETTIGRHDGNDIRLDERNVSRRHCRLLRFGNSLVVEDLQSANGLRVNGTPVFGRHAVSPGDRIRIGDYSISVDGAPGEGGVDSSEALEALEAAMAAPTQRTTLAESPGPAWAPRPAVSSVVAAPQVPVIARTTPGPAASASPRVPAPIPPFPIEAFRALQARGLVPSAPPAPAASHPSDHARAGGTAKAIAPASEHESAANAASAQATPLAPAAASARAAPPAPAAAPAQTAARGPAIAPVRVASPLQEPEAVPLAAPPVVQGAAHRTGGAAPAREVARMVVLTTELAGTSVSLPSTAAWIGRGPDADLVLDHRSIAERHCRIEPNGDGSFHLFRADPSLALSVNGEPVESAVLSPGDTVRIGAALLRLIEPAPRG